MFCASEAFILHWPSLIAGVCTPAGAQCLETLAISPDHIASLKQRFCRRTHLIKGQFKHSLLLLKEATIGFLCSFQTSSQI
jgi:hypothetical protein